MNEKLKNFAKEELKRGLTQLPDGWQRKFKQMYGHGNLEADINSVVDNMSEEKLDRAMEQVCASIKKIETLKQTATASPNNTRSEICPRCKGSGVTYELNRFGESCFTCRSTGKVAPVA